MRAYLILVTALLPVMSASAQAEVAPAGGYVFEVDGKSCEPSAESLSVGPLPCFNSDALRELRQGDLVWIGSFRLPVGSDKVYRFVGTPEEDRLSLVNPDGSTRIVYARYMENTWDENDKPKLLDSLSGLSDEDVRGLWGVDIDLDLIPPDMGGVGKKLLHVDPERAFIWIRIKRGTRPLPQLPEATRYLNLLVWKGAAVVDLSTLGGLRSLRYLKVGEGPFDLSWIQGNRDLRYLDLSGSEIRHPELLSGLEELRYLSLSSSSGVVDLTPASVLPRLVAFDAGFSRVISLPVDGFRNLRQLDISGCRIPIKEVVAFGTSHPECKVRHRFESEIQIALGEITSICVRSGGTCHRDVATEKMLFEEKDPFKISQLIENLRVKERENETSHCMCCGDPSVEFYRENKLIQTVGLHHGDHLRWPGMGSDEALLRDAADFICCWLAENGVTGPLEERMRRDRGMVTLERRWQCCRELLPGRLAQLVDAARPRDELLGAFTLVVVDPVERGVLFFRVYGCDNGAWNHDYGLDDVARAGLEATTDKEALAAAARKAVMNPAGARGLARWLFDDEQWGRLDAKALTEVIPAAAREGLSHPRPLCRRRSILALDRIRTDESTAALRAVLRGAIVPRPLPVADAFEPGGMVVFKPGDRDVPDTCSDSAHAALVLARRGDQASLPAIRALAEKAEGEDKPVLEKAVGLLTGR